MYHLNYSQKIPLSLEESWDFFSSPKNLALITPDYLNFTIKTENLSTIYPGQLIEYTVQPLWNIPLTWLTEITHVDELNYFIDEQRKGPYSFWHHEHRFKRTDFGTEIEDRLTYDLPFGIIGKLIHHLKVEKDVQSIFLYRNQKLEQLFGPYIEN